MIYTSNTPPGREYEIEYYSTAGGDCPVKELLDAMPLKHRVKTRKFFALLEETGSVLPRPYADAVRGKIRELVVDIQHHGYRFLHFYAGKTIVMTHGFLKKTPRTPPSEIERAERYMNDWLRRNTA
jgi:phage-related protein